MGRNERFPEFCCRACGSPGIRIDGPLEPNAAVRCGRCEADLGDWGSFVEAAEALLRPAALLASDPLPRLRNEGPPDGFAYDREPIITATRRG